MTFLCAGVLITWSQLLLALRLQVWEDGPVLRDLAARKAALQKSREQVDAARKVWGAQPA